ncbi:zonadhesin [Spodoptera frugiperda]|uniref:Zonadhesin n=1 Tax=Spodoptera frugiperda TaxID=7108 RepID=A0A9R0CTM5_SPOFR|nr:zonadhesin [Spodoptera frugiperda]
MAVRLWLCVALVTHVLVVVLCNEEPDTTVPDTTVTATDATESTSTPSFANPITSKIHKKVKCRKIKKCPKNEEFSICPQSLQRAQYCSEKGQSCRQQTVDQQFCKRGCVCQKGFLRADNGTCVKEEECPTTCGPNEIQDNCPANCESNYCPTSSSSDSALCTTPDVCPPPVCKCRFNYRRAINGTCIPTRSCPPFDCSSKPNEEFVSCPPLCPTDDCSQASPSGECPPLFGNIGIVLPCSPKCRCIKGYWRLNGTCVPYGQCPGVCPKNERYSECIQGECRALNCTQQGKSISCPRIRPEFCKKGCVCEEGYLRNKNGTCVKENQCEPPTCPANELWSTCAQATCRAEDCSQRGKPVACPRVKEEFCIKKCVCVKGFLRNEKGDCVPENQCPPPTCSENEQLENCSLSCNTDYCPRSEDENQICSKSETCIPRCRCQFNYRRAENGTCIPTESCPPFDCSSRPNEKYNPCPPICPTDDCGQPRLKGQCPYRIGIRLICNPKCECLDGYGRVNGTCVPFEECPDLCPKNEEYSPCTQRTCRPENCKDRNSTMEECSTMVDEFCERGCVCKENYYRNDEGDCVPSEECEDNVDDSEEDKEDIVEEPSCPKNEEYVSCIQGVCRAMNCGQKDEDVPCPEIPDEKCDSGCICKENYLRAENGTCVPKDSCEAVSCPENEQFSTCSQAVCRALDCKERGRPVACPMILEGSCIKECICKSGYLRTESGECVPEEKCPAPTCVENEVLQNCSQYCTSDYCPYSADQEQECYPPFPPGSCVPECKCRFNYRRSDNGTCIPTRSCPPFDCSDRPNEEYHPCPPLCPSDACGKPRLTGRCPFNIKVVLNCQPKCQCKDGYGRVNGTCVPFEECPDLCPANEEYSSCTQRICRPQNCSNRNTTMENCSTCDDNKCQRGCVCKENYYRNDKGVCVASEECVDKEEDSDKDKKDTCTGPNERYTTEFKSCPPNTCVSLVAKFKCDSTEQPKPGCICDSGYLRQNLTSPCIPICECPEMASSPDCQK